MGMLDGKIAIITGGTSGIGESSAELFVAEGVKGVLKGRRKAEGEAARRAPGSGKNGRRIAVDLRLAAPGAVGAIVMEHFDGLVSFDDLGRDCR